jgi:hypothetical protein
VPTPPGLKNGMADFPVQPPKLELPGKETDLPSYPHRVDAHTPQIVTPETQNELSSCNYGAIAANENRSTFYYLHDAGKNLSLDLNPGSRLPGEGILSPCSGPYYSASSLFPFLWLLLSVR